MSFLRWTRLRVTLHMIETDDSGEMLCPTSCVFTIYPSHDDQFGQIDLIPQSSYPYYTLIIVHNVELYKALGKHWILSTDTLRSTDVSYECRTSENAIPNPVRVIPMIIGGYQGWESSKVQVIFKIQILRR